MQVRRNNALIEVDDSSAVATLTAGKNCALKFQNTNLTYHLNEDWWNPEAATILVYNAAFTEFLGQIALQSYANTDPISSVTGAISSRFININNFFTSGQFIDFDWVTL